MMELAGWGRLGLSVTIEVDEAPAGTIGHAVPSELLAPFDRPTKPRRLVMVPAAWLSRAMGIVNDVAGEKNTTAKDILSRSRFSEHIEARHLAIRRIKADLPDISTPMLGAIFRCDHTTVLYILGRRARRPQS